MEGGGWVEPEAELLLPVSLPLRVDIGVKGVGLPRFVAQELHINLVMGWLQLPYTLHTNVYTQGKGNREQQFRLWFDPTADFHTYTILWNPRLVMFYVDGTLIRMFRNHESSGMAYPSRQAMRMYSSLWDAEDWATQGGRVKTDWSKVPFVATFGDVAINGCVWKGSASSCDASSSGWMNQAAAASDLQKLAWVQRNYMIYNYCKNLNRFVIVKMQWVQRNYMIYNYCKDVSRFAQGLPRECSLA
ncbi:hypothetical protein EJ110_NYTH27384 [Nymphaea thermarum]|nr:hypothetical protein EJ110_NYTH27384 [Nymphaea thermarum]